MTFEVDLSKVPVSEEPPVPEEQPRPFELSQVYEARYTNFSHVFTRARYALNLFAAVLLSAVLPNLFLL